jgi:acetyltransferase-like isoleucine patch superfamily enzyme
MIPTREELRAIYPKLPLPKRIYNGVNRAIVRKCKNLAYNLLLKLPFFHSITNTRDSQNPCLLRHWFRQRLLGIDNDVYWPIHPSSRINQPKNIYIGKDCAPGYEPGCYIQAINPVFIDDYTHIAANVGIISTNHDPTDLRKHMPSQGVFIGKYCWLGMGAIILPGVKLGDFSIVGANSVVTKSYPEGYCILIGSPARLVKRLSPEECVRYENKNNYHGFIRDCDFNRFRLYNLRI